MNVPVDGVLESLLARRGEQGAPGDGEHADAAMGGGGCALVVTSATWHAAGSRLIRRRPGAASDDADASGRRR